jgi:imidazolonepropionase-like amidohydrolase
VARFAKRLIDAGGRVQLGAHGQREGLGAHWELWSLVQGGFTPWEALRAATLHGAYYIGLDKDLGSLEPGKLADIALIDGDPLKDIRRSEHIRYVIANGRLFDARTMRERYPHKGKSPTFFFHTGGFGGDKETQQQGECPICRH